MIKRTSFIIFSIICLGIFAIEGCQKTDEFKATSVQFITPHGWPAPVYNFDNNPLTEEGIALGKKLFYDGRLSKDGGYPCASCHQQTAAFGTLNHDLSHGYNNSHTLRNAPPLHNLAWQKVFNADGSAATLEEVTIKHINNPTEMGETMDVVLAKLKPDAIYRSMFKAAFGSSLVDANRLTKALSQFMLTMVSSNSKYDQVKGGLQSFTTAEQTGYDLFKSKCASCHAEPLFTDHTFRNTGIPVDEHLNDFGRLRFTKMAIDSLKFKVPSLRNIEKTFPYAHDGRFSALDNVLEHYRSGVVNSTTVDNLVKNKITLTNFEFGQLKAFLLTLTDTSFINNKQFSE